MKLKTNLKKSHKYKNLQLQRQLYRALSVQVRISAVAGRNKYSLRAKTGSEYESITFLVCSSSSVCGVVGGAPLM